MTPHEIPSLQALRDDIDRDGYALLPGMLSERCEDAFGHIVASLFHCDAADIVIRSIQDDPMTERPLHHDDDDSHIVIALLSRPGHGFTGGELILVEQRPRMQSRVIVVPMELGDIAIVPAGVRETTGTNGIYRVIVRRATGRVLSGTRHTLEARAIKLSRSP